MSAEATEIPSITVRKGVPIPEKRKEDKRKTREVIADLKKGESFLIAQEYRNRVLLAANYLRRKGELPFKVMTRSVVEGGVEAVCVWRVEQ